MMKWGFAVHAGLGAVLVVATLGAGTSGDQGLETTLKRTVRGLEELAGLQKRIEHGDRDALVELAHVTDPAAGDPIAAEQRLVALRTEVARLRMVHDGLAPIDSVDIPALRANTTTSAGASTHGANAAKTTKGAKGDPKKGGKPTDDGLTSFEPDGFSADPVLQGEALFRAGRHDECLAVLRKSSDDPRAQYWSARALEVLGRFDEALALYKTLSARTDGGWAAARAKTDLEFLEWKRSSASTLDGTKTPTAPAPAPAAGTNRTLVPTKGPGQP